MVTSNIRKIMRDKGFKQSAIAAKAGFSEVNFSLLMTGRKIFRADYVLPIVNALGVTPDDLFVESGARDSA
ncbi:hypothetical protein FACS1894208_01500 [Clostridia bacterium]|nr:hypothetical protein FACS1894208_01500 [Clostridia bacterium]